MLINGKLKISMRATHIIGWSLPLIPLFLPLTDDNVTYGIDDQVSGISFLYHAYIHPLIRLLAKVRHLVHLGERLSINMSGST